MLACFEHWLGPYPWYDKGSGSSKRQHPGMEQQSYGVRLANNRDGKPVTASQTRGPRMTWIGLERIQTESAR
jgi:hypothetical protein